MSMNGPQVGTATRTLVTSRMPMKARHTAHVLCDPIYVRHTTRQTAEEVGGGRGAHGRLVMLSPELVAGTQLCPVCETSPSVHYGTYTSLHICSSVISEIEANIFKHMVYKFQ